MESLYHTIKEILDTGRIGVPVFARCTVQIAPENGRASETLAKMLAMVCSWLESSPFEVYAQSKGKATQITVTIQYVDGKTSIVSVNAAPDAATSVDLILLGNKGGIYHDTEALPPGFDITADPLPIPEWLIDAVEHSLRSGEPAIIEEAVRFE